MHEKRTLVDFAVKFFLEKTGELPAPSPAAPPAPATGGVFSLEFLERFLTSAGFGGVMAVIAAGIAATIALIQFNHAKRKDRDTRWWETLTWVYDRTVVEEGKKSPLPQRITFSLLKALGDEVTDAKRDRLQGEAVSSILTMFEDPEISHEAESNSERPGEHKDKVGSQTNDMADPSPEDQSQNQQKSTDVSDTQNAIGMIESIKVSDPEAAQMLSTLRNDLSHKGFRSAAANVGYLYEMSVESGLYSAAEEIGAIVAKQPHDYGVDFTVIRGHKAVLIVVKHMSVANSNFTPHIEKNLRAINARWNDSRILLIINNEMQKKSRERFSESMKDINVRRVVWRDSTDNARLRDALAGMLDH